MSKVMQCGVGMVGVVLAVVGGLAAFGVKVDARDLGRRPAQGAKVVINEVQYDPTVTGSETAYEWVELYNPGTTPVSLAGWQIADGQSADALPEADLAAGAFLVLAAGQGFAELFPGYSGPVVVLGGSIGNGLGNSGDQVRLLAPGGELVDGLSYGDNAGLLSPPAPDVAAGHSLERVPAGKDTDTAGDWLDQPAPSPGAAAGDLRPTEAPTAAPLPTLATGAVVVLNEHLPAPRAVDWDGDGQATRDDEWVELFNPGDEAIELRGWQVDDVADGGSAPYDIPSGWVIQARGHLVIFKRESGISLNNDTDTVRLLRPDGSEADTQTYTNAKPDASFARQPDGVGPWTDALPPSPGRPNGTGATPPPGGSTATPGGNPPATSVAPTPGGNGGTPGAGTPAGPTRPAPEIYLPFLVSEVMFDPEAAGNDAAREWVEIYNRGDAPAELAGWAIGDRARWDELPAAVVPPRGFAVVAASQAVADRLGTGGAGVGAAAVVAVADGAIGNGLANRGDLVRLRGPTGAIADAVSYGNNLDAFDPAVPMGPPGSSIERLPPDLDTDSAADWWVQPAPSPGRAGTRHEGPPEVKLNEVLPAPIDIDWDGDGSAGFADEWIELYNAADYAVDLGAWRLEDRETDGWSYELPAGSAIPSRGFAVIYRAASGIALDNAADTIRLIRPDGVVADRFAWVRAAGYDRSWSRGVDGAGEWTADYAVTPGAPNRPMPAPAAKSRDEERSPDAPPAARAAALSELRALRTGTRVQVRGRITAPPGSFGNRTAYVGDETSGVMVFLDARDAALPPLAEGERVVAVGRLKDYHGERELVLEEPGDLVSEGPGDPVPPIPIATGALDESAEGRLVRLRGRVAGGQGFSATLDDGSGPARIVIRRETGLPRLGSARGATLEVIGIASQYASRSPWQGGYRVLPRSARDLGAGTPIGAPAPPFRLPATGFGGAWRERP